MNGNSLVTQKLAEKNRFAPDRPALIMASEKQKPGHELYKTEDFCKLDLIYRYTNCTLLITFQKQTVLLKRIYLTYLCL
jgi:hypothetical protein